MSNILETKNLCHDFSGLQVLTDVNLDIREGERHAIIGPNGAGKTTTLRAISGLLRPENGFIKDGFIKFRDQDITNRLGTYVVIKGRLINYFTFCSQNVQCFGGFCR